MKSKLVALAVASLVGLAASADVLYWQVNNAEATANSKDGVTPAQAYLMAKPTTGTDANSPYYVSSNKDAAGNELGEAIGLSSFDGSTTVAGVLEASKILSWANDTAYSGDISGLSFFVELYDSAGNWAGTTDAKTYQQLVDSGAISSSGLNPSFTGVNSALGGSGSSYSPVPEPTSGLLMLIGLGALALRRRRA